MGEPRTIPLREGTVIAGKYRLERPLARGGMGAVWVARHLQLDEAVAVKFMDISLPAVADARVRFEREAKSAARIRSPHVVQILDHGVDGEMPYIVMELLEGEHLGTRLKREGRLCLSAVAVIAEQVAKALHRAHRAGIIHRDLKPANVFLARVDEDEIIKILDFGIVKSMGGGGGSLAGEATKSDVLMGSPNYMSPEQARGARSVDHRTDLWSLAVVLFRATTGKMAFSGDSVVDVILKICTGPIPVPSAVAPDLPPEVDAFFQRALERDPARRFSSAREMGGEFMAMVKALGPKADQVGPLPTSAIEPPDQVQSSVVEVASGDIVVSSSPGSPDGTFRWRQLLQGSVETPTVPHSRSRAPSSAFSAPPTEAKSKGASPSSAPATLLQKDASTPLATLLKPPAEPQPMNTSLATLLRPPSGSPANAASALLKPSSPLNRASATPVPPTVKGHMLVKSAAGPRSVLTAPETSAPHEPAEADAEPSAFIRLTSAGASANKMPQSDRSAEIAQFIDQAFLALQASDPLPQGSKAEPPAESHAPSGSLIKLGPPSWPAGPSGTAPVVASLLGKSSSPSSGSSTVAALLNNLSKSSSNPITPRSSAPASGHPDSTMPPADETSIIEPNLSPAEASRLKAQRAAHADRISKLVDEGFAALKRGDRTLARACWSEALSLDPTDRMLKLNLRKLDTKEKP
jgi:eukaryotic-like serine/threonine-protein kinase